MKWKDVVGYERLYRISDHGRVFSIRSNKQLKLRFAAGRKRYPQIILCLNGNRRQAYIHILMLEAFVGPRPKGYESCHNNDDPLDNRLSNLRWDTVKNNQLDCRKNRRRKQERRVRRSDNMEFDSIAQAAEASGTTAQHIWNVCNNIQKTTNGYAWVYI